MTGAVNRSLVKQRALFPLILAVSLLAALIYFVDFSRRTVSLSGNTDNNLIGMPRSGPPVGRAALANVPALAANPLDQKIVNGVIAARLRATGDIGRARREVALLRQLGWRNTNALQNLLWLAGTTSPTDLPLMMDTLDALLRREQLLGQVYPVLNLMTTDPAFRAILARRLARHPPWRLYYLMSASDLSRPDQIEGRYLLMRAIQRSGGRLARNEIAPVLPKLIGIGRPEQAFALWGTQAAGVSMPLTDTNFAFAAGPVSADTLPVPFEWQLKSGSGYVVDAGRDDHGSFMSIDWSGRGTPSFASQRTTARAGRYRLVVTADPPMSTVANRIGFRLLCTDGSKAEFNLVSTGSGGKAQLVGIGRVACNFPELELYGLIQTGTSAASVMLRTVLLERMN